MNNHLDSQSGNVKRLIRYSLTSLVVIFPLGLKVSFVCLDAETTQFWSPIEHVALTGMMFNGFSFTEELDAGEICERNQGNNRSKKGKTLPCPILYVSLGESVFSMAGLLLLKRL